MNSNILGNLLNSNILDVREKKKMAGITQNGQETLIFIVVPKQRK